MFANLLDRFFNNSVEKKIIRKTHDELLVKLSMDLMHCNKLFDLCPIPKKNDNYKILNRMIFN